ncbi:MAG TPA: ATP-binding protein [Actinomycetota bacterium]
MGRSERALSTGPGAGLGESIERSEAERAREALWTAVTVYRWAALAWMIGLAATVEGGLALPGLGWPALAVAALWTATASTRREASLLGAWTELVLAFALVVLSGTVAPPGAVATARPFFATAWPVAAVAVWGIARGPFGGIAAGLSIGVALTLSRWTNEIPPWELTQVEVQTLVSGTLVFVLAGAAVGLVGRLLERSAREYRALIEVTMRARERVARSEERESIARQIHDSVLQALALVHKRGRELGRAPSVPGPEVTALADMAGRQEAELRALIVREPEAPSGGRVSLRSALEEVARAVDGIATTVSATGALWVPAHVGDEVALAVRQALDNVVEHAGATRATVFADRTSEGMVVSVRDDGRGFDYHEAGLQAAGKLGMLKSMKGRVEALGGAMHVASSATGTEIEFAFPVEGQ